MEDDREYEINDQIDKGLIDSQSTEVVKYVLGIDDIILKVDEYLSGYKQIQTIDENNRYKIEKIKYSEPKISDEGRYELLRQIEFRCGKIFSLSNYWGEDVNNIAKVFGLNFLKQLYICKKHYNLKPVHIGVLYHEVLDAVIATLKKGHNQSFIRFLKDTSRTVETRQFGNKNNKQNVALFNSNKGG